MSKEAIGIAINGRDIKIAHIYREKNKLTVDFLENATLNADPEAEVRNKAVIDNESLFNKEEDVFAIKNPLEIKKNENKETSIQDNADILYSLLIKYADRTIRISDGRIQVQ